MDHEQCVKEEMEYREWRKTPLWYCVKTVFNKMTGAVKSEIMKNEKTNVPIAIQDLVKPQDGVYEKNNEVTYYTYHRGYEEAERQVAMVSA